jgi:hypothetical protein
MKRDGDDVILSRGELASLVRTSAVGSLGVRAAEVSVKSVDLAEGVDLAWLAGAVGVLADPAKRVDYQSLLGRSAVTRRVYAWSRTDPERVVALTDRGSSFRISEWTSASLVATAQDLLAIGEPMAEGPLGLQPSAIGLLVWLAVVDHVQAERLQAILTHAAPIGVVRTDTLRARLDDSLLDDVRWPLLFLSRVMPAPIAAGISDDELRAALAELAELELLEAVDDTGAMGIYEVTAKGAWLADETLTDVSKLAVGLSEYRPDGVVGYESMLFVRSPRHVVFYDLGGDRAAIATATSEAVDALLATVFASPSAAVAASGSLDGGPPLGSR